MNMSARMNEQYDIVIVGAGMAGMAAALALSTMRLKICIIESTVSSDDFHTSYDDRTLVVNKASKHFWQHLGIWQSLADEMADVDSVHVSNKGQFGSVLFNAKDLKVDVLAHIVEAKVLAKVLRSHVEQSQSIKILCPAKVTEFSEVNNKINVCYQLQDENEVVLSASLMLAADGAQSNIRKQLDLEARIKSYDRIAVVCNITPEYKHRQCAYERLTPTGPTAILPFKNNRCGFVWTLASSDAEHVLSLSDDEFLSKAQNQFGYRLGRFMKVGKRSSYPLYLVEVPQQAKSRVILLGNAAHCMSPVSAQGLNLAVRDVAMLLDVLKKVQDNNGDIGSPETLKDYQNSTAEDQKSTMQYTDDLMSWFKIDNGLVNSVKSTALFLMDQMLSVKSELYSRTSGYRTNYIPQFLRKS